MIGLCFTCCFNFTKVILNFSRAVFWKSLFWHEAGLFFFQYMKFIVKLVSIQHPVLIPKDALFNAHHLPSPPSHPHQPSVCSQFLRVSYALALSHSNLFFCCCWALDNRPRLCWFLRGLHTSAEEMKWWNYGILYFPFKCESPFKSTQ